MSQTYYIIKVRFSLNPDNDEGISMHFRSMDALDFDEQVERYEVLFTH